MSQALWKQYIYLSISFFCIRCKYYLAWALSDTVNIASGLGFEGFDEKGNSKWDLCKNIDVIKLEVREIFIFRRFFY